MRRFVAGSSILSLKDSTCTVIAADSKLSYGYMAKHKGDKIFRFNDTLVAFSGEYSDVQETVKFIEMEQEKEEVPLVSTSYFKMLQRFLYSKRSRLQPLGIECVVGGRGFLGCIDNLGNFFESDVICTGMGAHLGTPCLRASKGDPILRIKDAMELMAKRDCRGSNEIQVGIIDESGIRFQQMVLDINWDIGNNNEIVYS